MSLHNRAVCFILICFTCYSLLPITAAKIRHKCKGRPELTCKDLNKEIGYYDRILESREIEVFTRCEKKNSGCNECCSVSGSTKQTLRQLVTEDVKLFRRVDDRLIEVAIDLVNGTLLDSATSDSSWRPLYFEKLLGTFKKLEKARQTFDLQKCVDNLYALRFAKFTRKTRNGRAHVEPCKSACQEAVDSQHCSFLNPKFIKRHIIVVGTGASQRYTDAFQKACQNDSNACRYLLEPQGNSKKTFFQSSGICEWEIEYTSFDNNDCWDGRNVKTEFFEGTNPDTPLNTELLQILSCLDSDEVIESDDPYDLDSVTTTTRSSTTMQVESGDDSDDEDDGHTVDSRRFNTKTDSMPNVQEGSFNATKDSVLNVQKGSFNAKKDSVLSVKKGSFNAKKDLVLNGQEELFNDKKDPVLNVQEGSSNTIVLRAYRLLLLLTSCLSLINNFSCSCS